MGRYVYETNEEFSPKAFADFVSSVVNDVKMDWPGVRLEVSTHDNFNRSDVYRHIVMVSLYIGHDSKGVIVKRTVTPQNAGTEKKLMDLIQRLIMRAFTAAVDERLSTRTIKAASLRPASRPAAQRLTA